MTGDEAAVSALAGKATIMPAASGRLTSVSALVALILAASLEGMKGLERTFAKR
ncbi:hypothetical protein CPB83DRAFT_864481 [Crepidotus variabilis]|uniref:Uncharacterized protein n=1 Tax=Crepidotus variabilis TaxID=179855 RepID=A0A9P6E4L9_9AGAR|nr:hypothetical protein CPB83DRAFT_864481 [Crepidotus variabilis]